MYEMNNKMFCIKARQGTGTCGGDSGAAAATFVTRQGKGFWVQLGVMSQTLDLNCTYDVAAKMLAHDPSQHCNFFKYNSGLDICVDVPPK
ncbi:unnamed protein product, partial [Mesorhabditis spiculigera]